MAGPRPNAFVSSGDSSPIAIDHELIVATLLDAVLVFSLDDHLVWLNHSAEALLGSSRRSLQGKSAVDLFSRSRWIADLVARLREVPDKSLRGEGDLRRGDGELGVVAVVTLLHDRQGARSGTVLSLADHRSRRGIQRDDLQAARPQALNRLVSAVAHELNNPLAGIRAAAQAIGPKSADAKMRSYAEMIVRQADRMSGLIDSLLMLEIAPSTFQPTNIHRVLTEVLELEETVASNRGVRLEWEFDPSLPDVPGDGARLQQLFLNVVKNAIEACPAGDGRVSVRTRMENDFYVSRGRRRVQYISVEIADTGPGLDPEALANVFTPFYSRSTGGHGLGLSIANSIAAAHSGYIRADNRDSGGASFRVYLPVADNARA